ncbi:uncharacterized protein PFL1_05044 [Pseudozyma flocculosa PF-1]|uniref:Uncharacterized protein n=1 Tax=Pseudozyma flocculosa PF-1 TaxID=1277687 RepID=A0A061HAB8_9BASI|nr:uncharacterized protein PFL1_05044 [Pseudozyma flocculosa PF-1]EPQ27506.1 hypothetical protein PFL1_05044 [Pseudozyma flocculosa PF-1]
MFRGREDLQALDSLGSWLEQISTFEDNRSTDWDTFKSSTELKRSRCGNQAIDKQEAMRLIKDMVEERRRHSTQVAEALNKSRKDRGTPLDALQ